MNADIKAAWLTALRSGKYKQGQGVLRSTDNYFCCLGVLADIVAPEEWGRPQPYHRYRFLDDWACTLPPSFMKRVGLQEEDAKCLIKKNDFGISFTKIADWIEENL